MSLPYFPMYVSDFEAGAAHLDLVEDGALNRLLRQMWQTPGCSLPDDNNWIKRKMRCSEIEFERIVLPIIDEFMVRERGRVHSPRLTKEYVEAKAAYERRSKAGKKGAEIRYLKTKEK